MIALHIFLDGYAEVEFFSSLVTRKIQKDKVGNEYVKCNNKKIVIKDLDYKVVKRHDWNLKG